VYQQSYQFRPTYDAPNLVHIDLLRATGGDVDSPGRFDTGRDNARSTRRLKERVYAAIFFELSAALRHTQSAAIGRGSGHLLS